MPVSSLVLCLYLNVLGVCLLVAVAVYSKARGRLAVPAARGKALADSTQDPQSHPTTRLSPAPTTEKDTAVQTMPSRPTHSVDPAPAVQTYDAFLVLDVEATCQPGTDFNYANEIIASGPALCSLTPPVLCVLIHACF